VARSRPTSGVQTISSLENALAHIIPADHGTSIGIWGSHTLRTAFQPIFAFKDGKLGITAFEALIRPFRHDVPVSPHTFLTSIPAPDRLAVETLSRTLHLLNAGACLPDGASLFINFDPSVFVDRAIADGALRDMRGLLNRNGINPARVVCEVTEQRSASSDTLDNFVAALKANGFRIAVDDFGAEDSDIDRVRALRPDIVKFDAKWITRLMESGPGVGLLTAMVDLFRSQDILTVFEGLEENWQLEYAERAGASMVQGYVLARPELAPTSFSIFPITPMQVVQQRPARRDEPKPTPVIVEAARPHRSFGRRVVC
jgi:EAL domain-containing protein (putative c-di-GMP-specific phosphodiesterase class I)